jgi:hypothetical protein
MSSGTPPDAHDWDAHRAALEHWRDIYVSFLDSDSDRRETLRNELQQSTVPADRALEAADCHVAAPNVSGQLEAGLAAVVSWIERRRNATDHPELTRIATLGEAPRGILSAASDGLLETIGYGIELLRENAKKGAT